MFPSDVQRKARTFYQRHRDGPSFVELRMRFIGEIRRQDLVSRFAIQSAAASTDITLYKELALGNYKGKGELPEIGYQGVNATIRMAEKMLFIVRRSKGSR